MPKHVTREDLDRMADEFDPIGHAQGFNVLRADNAYFMKLTYANSLTEHAFHGFVMARLNDNFEFKDMD